MVLLSVGLSDSLSIQSVGRNTTTNVNFFSMCQRVTMRTYGDSERLLSELVTTSTSCSTAETLRLRAPSSSKEDSARRWRFFVIPMRYSLQPRQPSDSICSARCRVASEEARVRVALTTPSPCGDFLPRESRGDPRSRCPAPPSSKQSSPILRRLSGRSRCIHEPQSLGRGLRGQSFSPSPVHLVYRSFRGRRSC